jgi:flagellar biosynthesis protein FliQ
MLALFAFSEVLHPLLFLDSTTQEVRLPFLPRLLTSVVCGLYLFVAWMLSALVLWRVLW